MTTPNHKSSATTHLLTLRPKSGELASDMSGRLPSEAVGEVDGRVASERTAGEKKVSASFHVDVKSRF